MQRFTSKMAGMGDWFSVPEEGRQNMEQISRQNAIQDAIRTLSVYQNEPEIAQIIGQLNMLRENDELVTENIRLAR